MNITLLEEVFLCPPNVEYRTRKIFGITKGEIPFVPDGKKGKKDG